MRVFQRVVDDGGFAAAARTLDLSPATLDGAGVAVLSRLLAAPHLESGALVHLLPDWIHGRLTVYAAVPTRKLIPARTRTFLNFIGDLMADRTVRASGV